MPLKVPLRLALLLAPVLALTLVQPLTQSAQAATVPVPKTRTFQAGIDAYGAYVGQSACNATAKPGVVYVKDLLNSTYGPRTVGIVRSCTAGGQSEHKEGRALDWMISSRVASQKAQADAFVSWLLAKDKFGNTHAMARRMGVMYIIWNNKMWRAYDPGRGWAEYKGCSSTTSTGNDTTCHRDHVHISFTWDGAYARTSLFTGKVPFAVAADVSDSTPNVGDTVRVSGSVSPAVGASGKQVSIKRFDGTKLSSFGIAPVDSSGGYSYSFKVTTPGVYRFKVYKAAEGCSTSGCAYGSGLSSEVGFTTGGSAEQARYTTTLQATPDIVPIGTPVKFTGTVAPANAAAGQSVSLKVWSKTANAYASVAVATIQADGTFEFTATPPKGASQYVAYKPSLGCTTAGCTYASGVSPVAEVNALESVPFEVDAKASAPAAPVGQTVTISGDVSPSYASAGGTVSLHKVVGEGLKYVGFARLDSNGEFKAPIVASGEGKQSYRIRKPSDGCDGSGCDFSGGLSAPVTVNSVVVRKFSVVASPSSSVLLNNSIWVAATFSPTASAAGNRVVVQEYISGAWRTLGSRTLDAQGRVGVARSFSTAGVHKYRFVTGGADCKSGVCAFSGGTSPTITVKAVLPGAQQFNVFALISKTQSAAGTKVRVYGRVAPYDVAAGTNIWLRRDKSGSLLAVKGVDVAKVGADGRFSFLMPVSGAGTQYFRVYHGPAGCTSKGCLYGADLSNRLTLKVT